MESRSEDLIQIDARSHLEAADACHRYGKNLRHYFKEYSRLFGVGSIADSSGGLSLAQRFKPFFQWLDGASSSPRPELPGCPRATLDNDRVLYLRNEEDRAPFLIRVDEDGRLHRNSTDELISTGSKGWIFVIKNWKIYACEKRTSAYPRFHHSSFFAGEPVQAAGMFIAEQGRLSKLFPHSGHYRPEDRQFRWLLTHLQDFSINLIDIKVDAQRIYKVSRQTAGISRLAFSALAGNDRQASDGKAAKVDTALFASGHSVLNFLNVKRKARACGLLEQICAFAPTTLRRSTFAEASLPSPPEPLLDAAPATAPTVPVDCELDIASLLSESPCGALLPESSAHPDHAEHRKHVERSDESPVEHPDG